MKKNLKCKASIRQGSRVPRVLYVTGPCPIDYEEDGTVN